MTMTELRAFLSGAGASVGLSVNIDAPPGVLTPSVKAAVIEHKPVLAGVLALEWLAPGPPPGLTDRQRGEWLALRERLAAALPVILTDPEWLAEREAIQSEAINQQSISK